MFRKILVTLDGSEFAERALEPALEMAQKFGSEVILLRVVVPDEMVVTTPGLGAAMYYETKAGDDQRAHEEADGYLYSLRTRWLGTNVLVRTQAIAGTPADVILDAATVEAVDLIVMSTHGRSGLSRLLYGSVAEAVLRGARRPILLIPIAG